MLEQHLGALIAQFAEEDEPCTYFHCTSTSYRYRGADKSLAQPTSWCILFDGENILFDASLVIHINSTNVPAIIVINRIYKNQNLLLL